MLFLLAAFTASPRELAGRFKSLANPKAAFFLFWILFFVISHLWNFRTAPWNGDALFDESGWDLWYLKSYVIGHPYQPAWFHIVISRETLFHYYVWGFLKLFGFNILSYQAALFVIWLTTFVFTLLLVDLFFESYIVTSVTALIFNFLPFAFIYTFAGYRYPMAVALAVVSLYFLHVGFKNGSPFCLSLGGIAAGLCLASSISGKQYLLALVIAAPLYGVLLLETLKAKRYMDLAGRGHLWLCCGCHANSALYRLQSRRLYFIRIQLSSRFLAWNAVSSISSRNQALYRTASELLFQCPSCPVFYSRHFAYPAAVLLAFSTRLCASALAEAL